MLHLVDEAKEMAESLLINVTEESNKAVGPFLSLYLTVAIDVHYRERTYRYTINNYSAAPTRRSMVILR